MGFGAKCCVRAGTFFDGTGAGNSRGVCGELRVLLVLFLRAAALTLRPCPPRFQEDSAAVLWGCWPWKGRLPRYGCRSRLWKVSSVFLLGSSVVMPCSRPARALPFPFSPTQQYRGPQDGSSPTASRPRYGRRSSLRAKVSLFDCCVFYSTLLTPRLCTFHPRRVEWERKGGGTARRGRGRVDGREECRLRGQGRGTAVQDVPAHKATAAGGERREGGGARRRTRVRATPAGRDAALCGRRSRGQSRGTSPRRRSRGTGR